MAITNIGTPIESTEDKSGSQIAREISGAGGFGGSGQPLSSTPSKVITSKSGTAAPGRKQVFRDG